MADQKSTEWRDMKIGDIKSIDSNRQVVRVVNGWIYESFCGFDRQTVSTCFIPELL
jgi:hypothetical protein